MSGGAFSFPRGRDRFESRASLSSVLAGVAGLCLASFFPGSASRRAGVRRSALCRTSLEHRSPSRSGDLVLPCRPSSILARSAAEVAGPTQELRKTVHRKWLRLKPWGDAYGDRLSRIGRTSDPRRHLRHLPVDGGSNDPRLSRNSAQGGDATYALDAACLCLGADRLYRADLHHPG